jgi:hypothetical protein
VTLFLPGGESKSTQPRVSQEVVNRPSVVAPSVSRARKAMIVAMSSSGKTNTINGIPTSFCSVSGIQVRAWVPRSSIPIPKEKSRAGGRSR